MVNKAKKNKLKNEKENEDQPEGNLWNERKSKNKKKVKTECQLLCFENLRPTRKSRSNSHTTTINFFFVEIPKTFLFLTATLLLLLLLLLYSSRVLATSSNWCFFFFHWILSNNKSFQFSPILLSILVYSRSAVIWMSPSFTTFLFNSKIQVFV